MSEGTDKRRTANLPDSGDSKIDVLNLVVSNVNPLGCESGGHTLLQSDVCGIFHRVARRRLPLARPRLRISQTWMYREDMSLEKESHFFNASA
jgi:hypothetical protein